MRLNRKITLIGTCDEFSAADEIELDGSYDAVFELDDRQTILEYLYFKKFDKYYTELGWWLEPGAKEFVKDFEDKWFHNQIDEFAIKHDTDFIKFLDSIYDVDLTVSDDDLEDAVDEYECIVENELNSLDDTELRELWEIVGPTGILELTVSCDETGQSIYGSVDLPELDEDELDD